MGATKVLATFVKQTSFEDIPAAGISTARYLALDLIGVALAGTQVPGAQIAVDYTRELAARPASIVIGAGFRTSPAEAAWCNGILGHCLEYEDAWPETMHPSSMIFPACLAVAEAFSLSGKRLLEAYVLGLEVIAKIATSSPNITHTRGWHGSSVYGTVAAAAAAAKLLDLDVDAIRCAVGIAASGAGGLIRQHGTMAKWYNQGNAARQGVTAALLAKAGYTADPDILEGPSGFMAAFHAEGGYDLAKMAESLGKPFHIVSPGVSIRTYPCAYVHHGPIDTLLELLGNVGASYDDVEQVVIPLTTKQLQRNDVPLHDRSLRENLRFPLAIALRNGKVRAEDFTEEMLWSAEIHEALGRIKLTAVDPTTLPEGTDPARYQPEVVLRLKDGREFRHRRPYPRGRYDDPAPRSEFAVPKFRRNAGARLSGNDVERCIDLVQRLEELENVRALTDIVGGAPENVPQRKRATS